MTEKEQSLLVRVARGDASAARDCVDRYGPLVWSLARRHTASAADAEDAVQDIFLSLWRSAGRFEPERSTEAGFVAMIARRRLIDLLRQRVRTDPATLPVDVYERLDMEDRIEASRVGRALSELRPEQRRVLLLSTAQGLSQEEIAESTGMPLGTVKAHARRGLLRLRELFFGGKVAGQGASATRREEVEP